MTELRYELAVSRIREMMDEETVEEKFRDYFRTVGAFVLLIDETNQKLRSGSFEKYSMEELAAWNAKLYEDILPDVYDRSYGNPAYATEKLGAEYGPVLSALYAEIRGAIAYVYEQKIEYLDILFELFVEIHRSFPLSQFMASAAARAALTPLVTPLVETVAPEMAVTVLPTFRVPAPLMPTNWSRTGTPSSLGILPHTLVPIPEVSE